MELLVRNQESLKFDVDGILNFNLVVLDREFVVTLSKNTKEGACFEMLPNLKIENPEELTELNPTLLMDMDYWRFFFNFGGDAVQSLLEKGKSEHAPFLDVRYTEDEGENPRVYLKLITGYFKNTKKGLEFFPM